VASSSENVLAPSSFSSSKSSPPTKKLVPNLVVHVPKKYHSLIVGKNGENVKRLEIKFNVKIEASAKLLPDEK
jgi:predicted PilT family ATPase